MSKLFYYSIDWNYRVKGWMIRPAHFAGRGSVSFDKPVAGPYRTRVEARKVKKLLDDFFITPCEVHEDCAANVRLGYACAIRLVEKTQKMRDPKWF